MCKMGWCRNRTIIFFVCFLLKNFQFTSASSKTLELQSQNETTNAKQWLDSYNSSAEVEYYKNQIAQWNYFTNITDHNLKLQEEAAERIGEFQSKYGKEAWKFNLSLISDPKIVRELKNVQLLAAGLDVNESVILSSLVGNMTGIYSTATVCALNLTTKEKNCSVQWELNPELIDIMAKNRDYDVLSYAWKSWRDASGKRIKPIYSEFLKLSNKGARLAGFNDTGDWWRYPYEDPDFETTLKKLWHEILPLYEQLHAYVRKRLSQKYKGRFNTSAIPEHILGNMWAQDWSNLFDFLVPYPKKPSVDVTPAMKAQNYTQTHIFELADQFFQSMGMIPMPAEFWNHSIYVKPTDGRSFSCHGGAWDFYNRKDFRIHMCTQVDMNNFIVMHHELGHVEYFLQYAKQPVPFRDGANQGFHEAVGDTIALSVSTPAHLKAIGLFPDYKPDDEQDINYLFKTALLKIAFLPFGYLIDLWRWNVFNGQYSYDEWNQKWVELRLKYQGIVPPVPRDKDDFDAGAKYHVPENNQYIAYYISYIIQFQFYESLCKASGYKGPLHRCDFYGSKKAGDIFSKTLSLGNSVPWVEAMKILTGQSSYSASSLVQYFDPLHKWLKKENSGECFGWGAQWPDDVMGKLPKPRCKSATIN